MITITAARITVERSVGHPPVCRAQALTLVSPYSVFSAALALVQCKIFYDFVLERPVPINVVNFQNATGEPAIGVCLPYRRV